MSQKIWNLNAIVLKANQLLVSLKTLFVIPFIAEADINHSSRNVLEMVCNLLTQVNCKKKSMLLLNNFDNIIKFKANAILLKKVLI